MQLPSLPRKGVVPITFGRRYSENPFLGGIQSLSTRTNRFRHSRTWASSKAGRYSFSTDDCNLAMFFSGRKRRTRPFSSCVYLFIHSFSKWQIRNQLWVAYKSKPACLFIPDPSCSHLVGFHAFKARCGVLNSSTGRVNIQRPKAFDDGGRPPSTLRPFHVEKVRRERLPESQVVLGNQKEDTLFLSRSRDNG